MRHIETTLPAQGSRDERRPGLFGARGCAHRPSSWSHFIAERETRPATQRARRGRRSTPSSRPRTGAAASG